MRQALKANHPDPIDTKLEPFRLIVTFKTGISLSIEIATTRRQQLLLQCLADNVDLPVPDEQLRGLAYGKANAENSAAAFSEDMLGLGERLARVLGQDLMRRTPDGYQLVTDRVRIFIPYNA